MAPHPHPIYMVWMSYQPSSISDLNLFCDGDRLDEQDFVSAAFIGRAQDSPALDGKIDVVSAFSVLHRFREMQ